MDTMADQRTMAKLLCAPTEGYAEEIMVLPILAEHFELKHSLINMMTSNQFFGLEKDNPHDHIRWFNKITSTIKYKDVPNLSIIKLMLFPFSLAGATRHWLKKEPPRSILTWEDLVSKFINEFFSPSRTTNLRKEISNFQQLASVKAVEEICVTCGGAHPYYQCLAADGNTFSEYRDNIQGYVAAVVAPIQQNQSVPLSELEKFKKTNKANMKAMQTQINNVKNELRSEMQNSIQTSMSNQTNELKNMMASFFQMNTASTLGTGSLPSNIVANPKGELKSITTRSGLVLDGPTVPMHPPFINPEEDERVEETLTDPEHGEYTIKVPPPLVQKAKPPSQRNYVVTKGFLVNLISQIKVPQLLVDFVIVDYESDPRVPLILGRPFLRTARALIGVHGEEMILHDGNERIILNMRHDTSSYSNEPHQESINMIDVYNVSHEEYREDLFATNHLSGNPTSSLTFHTDLTSPEVINLSSGNPTPISKPETKSSSSSPRLFPLKKDMESILEDSVDENSLDDNLVDTISEMFTDEHALDYSSPPLWDEYDDELFDFETFNDDPFDS
ncbi:reverse transcriptase domain-containing protein, partial [Tanacetum coccineum]